ncbi:MAG TPA: AI-2E family transporter [Chloroflexi bacterium]|nr:AI-2E family transporter [Chloroflexota bacterium]
MEIRTDHSTDGTDPRWSDFAKRTVSLIAFLLLALVVYRFQELLPPMMLAFLTAFILHPVVSFLQDRLPLSRGAATSLVFLVLILMMLATLAAPVAVVPSIQRAVRSFQIDFNRVIADIGAFLDQPLEIAGYTLDLSPVYAEISSVLRSFVTQVAQGTVDVALSLASGALWMLFIMVTAFYLVKDADRIIRQLDSLVPRGYQEDMARLRKRITQAWNAFLRGQLLLGLTIFILTTVIGLAIGLPYAVVMGVIAGLLEFVPNVGPLIALIPAVLVALFQGSTYLPLSNFWFAVVVLGIYIVIQQVESNLLTPRILGGSLDLHPLVVLIGIIIGGNLGGVLGMLLAAPVLATLRVIGYYVFCRLYDQDPFAPPPEEEAPDSAEPGLVRRTGKAAWRQLLERLDAMDSPEAAKLKEMAEKLVRAEVTNETEPEDTLEEA